MPRPVILGVVGDSASGKTTLTRGLVRLLGQEQVSHVCLDDYHRYDRTQRADMAITPLHPDCNYMDIMAQHLKLLRRGEAVMKPVYRHSDGSFGAPMYLEPGRFLIVEGLLGFHSEQLRVPGQLEPATALELEERIWEHMHFASHLRSERLGEFTIGTDLHRSDSLAIVQLLVLYHLVTARAKVALGGAEASTRL